MRLYCINKRQYRLRIIYLLTVQCAMKELSESKIYVISLCQTKKIDSWISLKLLADDNSNTYTTASEYHFTHP